MQSSLKHMISTVRAHRCCKCSQMREDPPLSVELSCLSNGQGRFLFSKARVNSANKKKPTKQRRACTHLQRLSKDSAKSSCAPSTSTIKTWTACPWLYHVRPLMHKYVSTLKASAYAVHVHDVGGNKTIELKDEIK